MDETKKYNLKNDIVFKAFFSRKGNEEFLIDFLESLLKIKISKIEIKEEVNLEQLSPTEKGGRLDLQATLNDGVIVNIELQMKDKHNMEPRSVTYASKVIARETSKGTKYEDVKNVIMINILGYNMFEFDEYISKTVIVLEKHREHEVIDTIQWYFIELEKFRNKNPNMDEKINQWLALIDDERKELVEMAEEKNKTIEKARGEITYLTGDAAVRRLAELREDWAMDYESGISYAKKEEKKEIAKKLLELGIELEKIIEATGLKEDEIERIKKNIIKKDKKN